MSTAQSRRDQNSNNIIVCSRFRPINSVEQKSGEATLVATVHSNCLGVTMGLPGQQGKTFNFDYVFPPDSRQDTVFQYAALPLVDAIFDGYNCTLFAYGQTGSGKTWTMEGDTTNPDFYGIIPRMVHTIFNRIMDDTDENNVEFMVQVSYVEIYNEKIKDLLNPSETNLRIRDSKGSRGVYIEGVTQPYVQSPEDVLEYMHTGHINRAVSSTRMNNQSSRSHAAFSLYIQQTNKHTQSKKTAKLVMVDLAGSEKLRKTHAVGQTLKEAQQINKSLMVLGLVINNLVEGKTHIPYRDSKLTRLLSDALGGNSKTCLVVTASPAKYNLEETVSTLRFGQRAKSIKNKAKVNQELSVAEYRRLLEKANERIAILTKANEKLTSQVNKLKRIVQEGGTSVNLADILDEDEKEAEVEPEATVVASTGAEMNDRIMELDAQIQQLTEAKDGLEEEIQDLKNDLEIEKENKAQLSLANSSLQRRVEAMHAEKQQRELESKTQHSEMQRLQDTMRREGERREIMESDYKARIDQLQDDLISERARTEELEERVLAAPRLDQRQQELQQGVAQAVRAEVEGHTLSRGQSQLQNLPPAGQKLAAQQLFQHAAEQSKKIVKYKTENDRLRSKIKLYANRDELNESLRQNWHEQLTQMEKAVLVATNVHYREKSRLEDIIREKDNEIMRLKEFLINMTRRAPVGNTGHVALPVKQRQSVVVQPSQPDVPVSVGRNVRAATVSRRPM